MKPQRVAFLGMAGAATAACGGALLRVSAREVRPVSRSVPGAAVELGAGSVLPVIDSSRSTQQQQEDAGPVMREELGRHTWTFLHTLAAQFPENPTRQEQKDAAQLVDILCRLYPCEECASHFSEYVREHPPRVKTGADFAQWMCEAHNNANMLLGKPTFECSRRARLGHNFVAPAADAFVARSRWQLDCGESGCRVKPRQSGRRQAAAASGVDDF